MPVYTFPAQSYSKSYITAYPRFRDLAPSTMCLLPWALTPDDFILVPIAKREPYQLFNLSTSLNCWTTTTRLRSSDEKEIEKQCQLQILFRQDLHFFFFLASSLWQNISLHSVDLTCPSQAHGLKSWLSTCMLLGGSRDIRRWYLRMKISSLQMCP